MTPTIDDERSSSPAPESPQSGQSPPPDWFRDVVWDSLLGALCPLIPAPFVDDLALGWTRRRLVTRVARRNGVAAEPAAVRRVAGGGKRFSCLMLSFKIVIYPLRKILRKVLYFLSIKDSLDTFSLLFHQGYLLHRALELGREDPSLACAGLEPSGRAVLHTLDDLDTKPLGRIVRGVLRGSRDLVRASVRWVTSRVFSRRSFDEVETQGADAEALANASPETSELLHRLLSALWGERAYRDMLTERLRERLRQPPTKG